jgi:hypothetical protein
VIAGLPWQSWLLLLGSVGVPLAILIAFLRVHRTERKTRRDGGPTDGGDRGPTDSGDSGLTGGGEVPTR